MFEFRLSTRVTEKQRLKGDETSLKSQLDGVSPANITSLSLNECGVVNPFTNLPLTPFFGGPGRLAAEKEEG